MSKEVPFASGNPPATIDKLEQSEVATPKSKSRIPHKWALIYCSYAVLGALLYGYDGTYFTGVQAMKVFINKFGDVEKVEGDGTIKKAISSGALSIMTSIVYAGHLIGSLSASFVQDRHGRKGGLFVAMIAIIIGVVIQTAADGQKGLIIGGRIVLGFGVGMVSNAVPQYLSEVPDTSIRASVVSSWQFILAIGQVVGACVAQGTEHLESSASYRIPMALQLFIPLTVYLFFPFVPESPRWLVSRGRYEQAGKALLKINKEKLPEYDETIQLSAICRDHEREVAEKSSSSWKQVFSNPIERRKFWCAFGILVSQQITGVQFIFSYATVFIKNVDLSNAFLWTIIIDICEVLGVVISFFLVNRIGRRPLLIWTSVVMIISLAIVGGLGTPKNPSQSEKVGIVVCLMIFVLFFNIAWGPLAWVLATELTPGQNRSKIMSVGTAAFWVVAFAVSFTLPYLYDAGKANLGPKVGYIYAGGCCLSLAFVYFFIGETIGRSLEDINQMFDEQLPVMKWKTWEPPFNAPGSKITRPASNDSTFGNGSAKGKSGKVEHEMTENISVA